MSSPDRQVNYRALLAIFLLAASLPARATSQDASCAKCHVAMTATQPTTGMGRALQIAGTNHALANHAHLAFTRGSYTYTVETRGGESTYTVTDGQRTLSLPIRWAFGAHNQTFLLERSGKFYESLVSYYEATGALDITTGDDTLLPATLDQALGREQSSQDAKACFGCHTSGAVQGDTLDLNSLTPGLTCAHCHTGSSQHARDALFKNLATAPPDLGAMSTEDISSFCAQCHRSWETVVRSHWFGPMNVRFQPYRLANSRCFNGTDPRISCVACHDPHSKVQRTATSYDARCLVCHGAPASAANPAPKTCPVAKSQCATCHMPKITLPHSGGHLIFTDHQIRVVRPGDAYPN